jgi:hypothetical protein
MVCKASSGLTVAQTLLVAGGDTQILRRGVQGAVPQQQLNGAKIGAGLCAFRRSRPLIPT